MNSIVIILIMTTIFFFSSCNKEKDPPDLSNEYPRILSPWPGKPNDSTLGTYDINIGETLSLYVIYTPSDRAIAEWYINNIKSGTGTTYHYTATEEGNYHIKVLVRGNRDSTFREANINVTDPLSIINLSQRSSVVATASGFCSESETPNHARDGDHTNTKWCDNSSGDKWLQYDFNALCTITKVILNWEDWDINSKYKIQTSADGVTWTDVVVATENNLDPAEHELNIPDVRFMRFWVDKDDDDAVRLMEFEVWGNRQ